MTDHLEGIAQADDRLGRPFPLPTVALPLPRWVEVRAVGSTGAEVEWNLDDTRAGAPGRLALYAGHAEPPAQAARDWSVPETTVVGDRRVGVRSAPLTEAQASLRPVTEVAWRDDDLHLRLTAQGPWDAGDLLQIVAAIPVAPAGTTPPV